VAIVPGSPETQTVSRYFPKVCAALQRKSGTGAAYRAGRVSGGRITTKLHCLGLCTGDATPLGESGSGRSLRRSSAPQL